MHLPLATFVSAVLPYSIAIYSSLVLGHSRMDLQSQWVDSHQNPLSGRTPTVTPIQRLLLDVYSYLLLLLDVINIRNLILYAVPNTYRSSDERPSRQMGIKHRGL